MAFITDHDIVSKFPSSGFILRIILFIIPIIVRIMIGKYKLSIAKRRRGEDWSSFGMNEFYRP